MNERIEKLYGQSFVNENYVNVGPNGTELVIRFDPEKFAELIVKECAGVCESMQLIGPYKEVQDATLKDASVQIKQHFGVEPCL